MVLNHLSWCVYCYCLLSTVSLLPADIRFPAEPGSVLIGWGVNWSLSWHGFDPFDLLCLLILPSFYCFSFASGYSISGRAPFRFDWLGSELVPFHGMVSTH